MENSNINDTVACGAVIVTILLTAIGGFIAIGANPTTPEQVQAMEASHD